MSSFDLIHAVTTPETPHCEHARLSNVTWINGQRTKGSATGTLPLLLLGIIRSLYDYVISEIDFSNSFILNRQSLTDRCRITFLTSKDGFFSGQHFARGSSECIYLVTLVFPKNKLTLLFNLK